MNLGDHNTGDSAEPRGWHSRGYLLHFEATAVLQAITYRLADALPGEAVERLKERALDDDARRIEIGKWLDAGHGSCLLCDAGNAEVVVEAWKYFDALRYRLHAWVVMPNHVHVLIEPAVGYDLGRIVHSWKSYSAKRILRGSAGVPPAQRSEAGGTPALLGKHRLWQPDYWDRFIRNERHYKATIEYIHSNPVKAGLVARAEDWGWSSARFWATRPF